MSIPRQNGQLRTSKWGWRILLVVSALLALNGVTWLFVGPSMSVSYIEQIAEVPSTDFAQANPAVADHVARNARQVAIWTTALSLMAFIVALEGSRRGSRWAWNAMWVFVAAPTAVGINWSVGGELGFDNLGMFSIAAVALVGQLLARRGLAS
ncbi:MAG: hypothetical protein ACE5JF_09765 [Anaerolineales bacterium]